MNYRRLSQVAEWAVLAAVIALHGLVFVLARRHADVAWLQLAGDAQPIALAACSGLGAIWSWLALGAGSGGPDTCDHLGRGYSRWRSAVLQPG